MSFDESLYAELEALRERLRALEQRLGATLRESLPEGDFSVLLTDSYGAKIAFLLEQVRVVVPAAELAPVPEAPDWLFGVLTLRGKSVPTIDVATRLGASQRRIEASDLIVVTEMRTHDLGFVVQGLHGVVSVPRASVETAVHETPHASYVLGTCTLGGSSAMIVSIAGLLGQVSELTGPRLASEAAT